MSAPAALKVKDLHKSFGSHEVIKGVSLEAQKGEVIAILGPLAPARAPFCAALTCWRRPILARSGWRGNGCG